MGNFDDFLTKMLTEKPGFAELWESRRVVRDLQTVMLAKGITQKELADLTGFSQSQISLFFSHAHSPTLVTVNKIASALGVVVGVIPPEDLNG